MTIVKYEFGENEEEICIWNDLFDTDERVSLQQGFLLTGLLSVLFSSWLSVTLLLTNLRFDYSYRNLANYTVIACIRRIVPVISYLPFVKCIETFFGFLTLSCNFFAFLETFLAVFEVECLTHVCIERYVVAKYITNGWQLQRKHYYLYVCLCVFFSCLYSIPPLFGIGRYGYDFQCTSCTFDMVLPDTWQRYIIVAIFILRSAKPVMVMMMMLIWARFLERKLTSLTKNQHLTRTVTVMALLNILCWTPIALIRGNVVLSSFMAVDLIPMPDPLYVMWAMWIHWIAPALTAIAVFLVDDRIRCRMFNFCLDGDCAEADGKKD